MENTTELLSAGLEVTLIGMSVVFLLLSILVGVVHGMSAFSRLFADTTLDDALDLAIDDETISVIGAAITQYRRADRRTDRRKASAIRK